MTKDRRAIRTTRLDNPTGQPEVKAFLAAEEPNRVWIYRKTWLCDWNAAFRAAESAFETARAGTAEWYTAGAASLQLIAARVELEALEIKQGTKMPALSRIPGTRTKQHKGEVGIAQLAWWYLHEGEYHQWTDVTLPDPQPAWSLGEFRALAKVMSWGDAAKDCTGKQGKDSLARLQTYEADLDLATISDFRRIIALLFSTRYEYPEYPTETVGRHADLVAAAVWLDIEHLAAVLEEALADNDVKGRLFLPACKEPRRRKRGVRHSPTLAEPAVWFGRNALRRILSHLIQVWKAVDPAAADYPDVSVPDDSDDLPPQRWDEGVTEADREG